ncbi:MAG: patatin [SAR324 cluster bacterium]|uniref:Patatin n=1 Tax=SAR324 cluster bacterium TaxID=2024889 RepID=A0A2A4ST55_9DELT|nr:MAG: patatin [SAR324 cluster bacterium]
MKINKSQTLREWLQEQPFTLTMSSGFFSFFAHCGMLSALEDEDLLPQKVTGSSAGALVGSCWAAGMDTERLQTELFRLRKEDFWDPAFGWGLLKGERFREIIRQMSPVERLEDCTLPVYLSAYDGFKKTTRIFKKGILCDVLYASCAVPFLFQPIRIEGRLYWDGGIKDRPGLGGIPVGERVFYHHIASRSPWRKKDSAALKVPKRANLASLVIQDLPRVSPNQMQIGPLAFKRARSATQWALNQPLPNQLSITVES